MISNMDMLVLDLEVYDVPATYNDQADFLDDDWSMNIHTMASHSAPLSPLPPPLPMQPPPLPTDD